MEKVKYVPYGYESTFVVNNEISYRIMRDYITNDLGVNIIETTNCGKNIISVPEEELEMVLNMGKEFACEKQLDNVGWVDFYQIIRPCHSVNIAYALLPECSSEKEEMDRYMWCEGKCSINGLSSYLKDMEKYLCVNNIFKTYNGVDSTMILSPQSLDYETQLKLIREFIKLEGYGPFTMIYPVSFTGRIEDELIPTLVKKC